MTAAVKTSCPYCGVGCGVLARPMPVGAEIQGDASHPANFGRLCSKGSALGETLGLEDRLLHPMIGDEQVGWNAALDTVANGFNRIVDEDGPDAVAFYVSGQLLTEDYYVANKLMKGYIGSANIDTNSRLCMSSAVVGHKRAFGGDLVPGNYEDLEQADLIVLVGSNTAWCHPVIYQRILAAREQRPGMKLVVIDPRRTATTEAADLHIPIATGRDSLLFNGLLRWLDERDAHDADFIQAHTDGIGQALAAARESVQGMQQLAADCEVDEGDIATFFTWFARTEKTVTLWSQGINQSSSGSDKVNAMINCHLLTGRIGRPGMGPFSITGQPNAMGGREVGGLATMLAAHMDIDNAEHRDTVQAFWKSPVMCERPGLQAVELFDAIHDGRVKAVWIMATNPLVSLPNADRARAALEKCELVVVSDCVSDTDTLRAADVRLPALGWGEKDGTVTNSERRISRQRAFLPAPGEARADWWIMSEVAQRMGFVDAFDYQRPGEIFDEHARLSGFRNDGRRGFDISGLAGLSANEYDQMAPVQWPVRVAGESSERLFVDGLFQTADQRARFLSVTPKSRANAVDDDFPLVLNTGRVRDHWHTMTRTGRSPRLADHVAEPYVQIHPQDALACGIRKGELARVRSRWGDVVLRVLIEPDVRRGMVFAPIHWNGINASDARVGAVVNPEVDPFSGEPEFKHTPVIVEPFPVDWHGFVLSRTALDLGEACHWVRVKGARFLRYEMAGRGGVTDWGWTARRMLGVMADDADWLEMTDTSEQRFRAAHLEDDRIQACIFVSPRPDLPSRSWLAGLFDQDTVSDVDRMGLLAGAPPDPAADTGPQVCACFGVGRNELLRVIGDSRLETTEAVGEAIRAGSNCGSCLPEIRQLLALKVAG